MKNFPLQLSLIFFIAFQTHSIGQGENLFDDTFVHEIRVTFDSQDFWNTLSDNYDENYPDIPYEMATVSIDGETLDSVGIRQKGFASHFGVDGVKKSLKLDFNIFSSGQEYDGLRKINLNNGAGDPAMQRDKLCYDIFEEAGIPSPRSSYAKVYLNDTYWGLYLILEQIDRTYLKDNFDNPDGNLFKNIGNSELLWMGEDSLEYKSIFELKTENNEDAWNSFIEFNRVLNLSTDEEFQAEFSKIFDIDRYLKILPVDVVTSNWDSYLFHGRNFYLYEDPVKNQFKWLPWDYNFAMGGTFDLGDPGGGTGIDDPENCLTITNGTCPYPATDSIFQEVINLDAFCCNTAWDETCQNIYDDIANDGGPGGGEPPLNPVTIFPVDLSGSEKVMITRLLGIDDYRERYYRNFCRLLEDNFTEERLFPKIENYGDLIRADIQSDVNYVWDQDHFELDLDQGKPFLPGLKRFISEQIEVLSAQLEDVYDCDNTSSNLAPLDVAINEFMASNDSTSNITDPSGEHEDWIELYNNTDQDINLSNAYLTDNNESPEKWNFPVGTMIKADDYLIIWADNDEDQEGLHCNFRLNKEGEFIMLMDNSMVLDSLSFPEQETNRSYSRIPNGTGDFIIKDPTLGARNSDPTFTTEWKIDELKIFPNPASHFLNIAFEHEIESSLYIRITNALGQTLLRKEINEPHSKIDIQGFKSGMYYVSIYENDKIVQTQRISIIK